MRGLGLRVALSAGVLALILATAGNAAAATTFTARGSVQQVYVTGLAPAAQVTLVNGSGATVATRQANSLGGTLFRDVTPGSGYRVRASGQESDPLTVLSTQSAPPSTDVYNQTIPSSGYGYLTTRDGTTRGKPSASNCSHDWMPFVSVSKI